MTVAVRTPRRDRTARFTQRDIARAIKGAVSAGMKVVGTRIEPDGALVLIYAGAEGVAPSAVAPLDDWLEKRRARAA
jgi:hypothetical protein